MKIVVDATAAVSGGKIYLDQLLPQLSRPDSGDEFIVFQAGELSSALPLSLNPQFHFHHVSFPLTGQGVMKMLWRLLVLPWHLRRLRPDLLFSNSGFGPLWMPKGTKLAVAIHNSMPLRDDLISQESTMAGRWRLRLLRGLMRHSVRRSDGAIVFSTDTARLLQQCFGKLKSEPIVIFHGIDWEADERNFGIDVSTLSRRGISQPYLLFVSHLHRYKNVVRLIEAFSLIAADYPALSLVLAGDVTDQIYHAEIEAAIAQHGLSARVRLISGCAREELKNIYRGARAFVQPSLAETFSLPLVEALALGLPIAAARMGALPEVAGEAAIYFDPKNPAEIADALRRVASDESLRLELSAKAAVQARKFSWEGAAVQTLRFFENLAESPRHEQAVASRQPSARV